MAVQGDISNPTAVKMELSSENDLFFHFTHLIDEKAFRAVRDEQRLMIEFSDYPVSAPCGAARAAAARGKASWLFHDGA